MKDSFTKHQSFLPAPFLYQTSSTDSNFDFTICISLFGLGFLGAFLQLGSPFVVLLRMSS